MSRLEPRSLRHLIVPGAGGRQVLRLLVPSACRLDCGSCPFSVRRQASLDDLARALVGAYRNGWCDGVFLTAGVPAAGAATAAMRRVLELVESLRFTFGFRGYLHVKVVAGVDPSVVQRIVRLVDRVSYGLEAPCVVALREMDIPAGEAAAVLDLERRGLVELQRARAASARSSPALLPVSMRPVPGVFQPPLFDTPGIAAGTPRRGEAAHGAG